MQDLIHSFFYYWLGPHLHMNSLKTNIPGIWQWNAIQWLLSKFLCWCNSIHLLKSSNEVVFSKIIVSASRLRNVIILFFKINHRWIRSYTREVKLLHDLCRRCIRQNLSDRAGGRGIQWCIKKLKLPSRLKDYLSFQLESEMPQFITAADIQ